MSYALHKRANVIKIHPHEVLWRNQV